MKKFLPFLIALFAGIAQGYSLAPAMSGWQLAALAVLFFIFAGLRTAKAGFLAGLFFGIGWFVTSLAWLYVSFMTTATSRRSLPPSLSSFSLVT